MIDFIEKELASIRTKITRVDKEKTKEINAVSDKIQADLDFIAMESGVDLDQDDAE